MHYFRRIVTLSALLLTVSLLTACNSKPSSGASEDNHTEMQANPSTDFENDDVVVKNKEETDRLAAEQGDAEAQCKLGLRYRDGDGVSKDLEEAVKWFRKAAEQGYAEAQVHLGDCYIKEIGRAHV